MPLEPYSWTLTFTVVEISSLPAIKCSLGCDNYYYRKVPFNQKGDFVCNILKSNLYALRPKYVEFLVFPFML